MARFIWDLWDDGDENKTDKNYPCAEGGITPAPTGTPTPPPTGKPPLTGCQAAYPPRVGDLNIWPSSLLKIYITKWDSMPNQNNEYYIGDSVLIELSNQPYLDRTGYLPPSAQDYRNADFVNIKVFDPCGNLFIDCPMIACPQRYGWYVFRIQTNDEFPAGVYRVEVFISNQVAETYGTCTPSPTSAPPTGTISHVLSETPGTTSTPIDNNIATTVGVKYFRVITRDIA